MTTISPESRVTISLATVSDLPEIAACDMLAFSSESDRIGSLFAPFRSLLARTGVHPRHWPDFEATVQRRHGQLLEPSYMFKAVVQDVSLEGFTIAEGSIAGVARLSPPKAAIEKTIENRRWKALGDYFSPVLDNMRQRFGNIAGSDGWNREFLKTFKNALERSRKENMETREHYMLEIIFVHPRFQGRGVGSALLRHCIDIAAADGLPLYLEAKTSGYSLYRSMGFKDVGMFSMEYKGETITLPIMVKELELCPTSKRSVDIALKPSEDAHSQG